MKPLLAALVAALAFVAPAGAQPVADHLKCYKVKDTQAKATYTADLGGLVAEPGCRIRVPGTLLCVETTKTNVTPTPPGGADNSGPAGRFMCYKLKCPKATLAALQWHDQFGDRQVTPSKPKILCAPEILAATTTTTTTLPTPPADLSITMTDGVTSVVPGTSDTYTITVSNSGPSAANDATVVDTLPVGLLNVSSPNLPAGVTFTDFGNGQVDWTGVDVASGGSIQLQLTGTVSSLLAAGIGTFVNGATVTPSAGGNNSFSDADSVTPQAILTLTKLVDGQSSEVANLDQNVTFEITVGNDGPSAATDVTVNDLLPAGLTFVSDIVPLGTTYDPLTGVWMISTLDAGATATLSITATVGTIGNTVPSSINQTATASADDAPTVSSTAVVTILLTAGSRH